MEDRWVAEGFPDEARVWEIFGGGDSMSEENWDRSESKYRTNGETFRRIHQLVKHGYRPEWNFSDDASIWFAHPGAFPRLTLFADGTVISTESKNPANVSVCDENDRIWRSDNGDQIAFDNWLATVKLPTWRERTRADRTKYIWGPGCVVTFFLAALTVLNLAEWGWHRFILSH